MFFLFFVILFNILFSLLWLLIFYSNFLRPWFFPPRWCHQIAMTSHTCLLWRETGLKSSSILFYIHKYAWFRYFFLYIYIYNVFYWLTFFCSSQFFWYFEVCHSLLKFIKQLLTQIFCGTYNLTFQNFIFRKTFSQHFYSLLIFLVFINYKFLCDRNCFNFESFFVPGYSS